MGSARTWRAVITKRMRALVKRAETQGWTVDCTSNGHVRFRAPTGEVVIGCSARGSELDRHYKLTVKRLEQRGLRT